MWSSPTLTTLQFHVWKTRFKFQILRLYRVLVDNGGVGWHSRGGVHEETHTHTHKRASARVIKGHEGPHTHRCRHQGPQEADHTWAWTPMSTGPVPPIRSPFGHLGPLGAPKVVQCTLRRQIWEKVPKSPGSGYEAVSVRNSGVLVPEHSLDGGVQTCLIGLSGLCTLWGAWPSKAGGPGQGSKSGNDLHSHPLSTHTHVLTVIPGILRGLT